MVKRRFWLSKIEEHWRRRSVVWLRGVRRSGKTSLCQTLPEAEYLDCERPAVCRRLEDAEEFLRSVIGRRVVLDEIHRLPDPAQLLKLAADHFPSVRIVATGSSTLEATERFRDKLTGRKVDLWLTPMNSQDLRDFGGSSDLGGRLLHGGLPPFFLADQPPSADFQEWIDSYWAKDIQELFRLERRHSFGRFLELLFAQSGGLFEATRFAAPCEISRQTVTNYLSVLEVTMVVHVVRPYSSRLATEIVHAPKVYAFDTGFVRHFNGWDGLRDHERGLLWEHYALNELQSLGWRQPRYWRDKQGREVDFIVLGVRRRADAVECKWTSSAFDPAAMAAFRRVHPDGGNWAVCHDVERAYSRSFGGLRVEFVGLGDLPRLLNGTPSTR